MTEQPAHFGVCTLRVERQPEHLLITINTNRYLAPGARRSTTPFTQSYASVHEALEAITHFLESFGTRQERDAHRGH